LEDESLRCGDISQTVTESVLPDDLEIINSIDKFVTIGSFSDSYACTLGASGNNITVFVFKKDLVKEGSDNRIDVLGRSIAIDIATFFIF
jgi:hypothetical protein